MSIRKKELINPMDLSSDEGLSLISDEEEDFYVVPASEELGRSVDEIHIETFNDKSLK